MKITKRQLRRIVKEEKARIREGRMKEMEGELIEDIIDLLASNGVIRPDADNSYDEALYWVESALIPSLQDMVDAEAGRNPGGSIG
jgi:hypothetical protein